MEKIYVHANVYSGSTEQQLLTKKYLQFVVMIFTRVFLPTNVFVQMAKNVLLESIPRFWGKYYREN